jgi:hypothetical protein
MKTEKLKKGIKVKKIKKEGRKNRRRKKKKKENRTQQKMPFLFKNKKGTSTKNSYHFSPANNSQRLKKELTPSLINL